MTETEALLEQTFRFVLSGVERELRPDIDWRSAGGGRNPLVRAAIYAAAMARDLARIPIHHPDGIAQARFRARVRHIESSVLPTVAFFLEHYPLSRDRREALAEAIAELERCAGLTTDGRVRALDEWYATMDEFAALTGGCRRAADALAAAIGVPEPGPEGQLREPEP